MTFEVEQKFPIEDPAGLSARIVELGGKFDNPVSQTDIYFAHPSRDFGQTDEALRIRHSGDRRFVTYKGPKLDAATKTRREIELPLPGEADSESFAQMLELLGFHPIATVRKTRHPAELQWRGWNVQVAVDEVEGLGSYTELEVSADEQQLETARKTIRSLATELQLSGFERRAYLELLLDRQS